MTPTTQRKRTTTAKAAELVAGLSPEERAELLAELEAEQRSNAEPWAPGAQPRELTARERAIRELMRERDHTEGCPLIADASRTAGRVEAFDETRPRSADGSRPAMNVAVVRCVECGGARYLEDVTVREALIEALRDGAAPEADDLDGSL